MGTAAEETPRIELSGDQETLLITLYAKALDYRSRHPILNDPDADRIVRSIDADFDRLRHATIERLLVARTRQLDDWVREFLSVHPTAVVLNLGCGLDARQRRLRPGPEVSWYDVDYPEVIELRHRFFEEGPRYAMLGTSLTEGAWVEGTPAGRPLLAVADGAFEYLTEAQARTLVGRLIDRAPYGQIAFDVINAASVRRINQRLRARGSRAELRWAVDDLGRVDRLDPRLRRLSTAYPLTSPYLPLGFRLLARIASLRPDLRTAIRLVRYRFEGEALLPRQVPSPEEPHATSNGTTGRRGTPEL